MMSQSKRTYVIDMLTPIVGNKQTAEAVVERLTDEGLLVYGYGNADIDKVVEAFTETFGTTKTSKPDRWAANRLVNKYGSQTVVGIVRLLGQYQGEKYAPVLNNVVQLEEKWVQVMNFLRKQNKGGTIEAL
jgi:hypothetical protein